MKSGGAGERDGNEKMAEAIKYAVIIVSTLPMLPVSFRPSTLPKGRNAGGAIKG